MKQILKLLVIIAIATTILSCSQRQASVFKPKEVYKSEDLIITQITEKSFIHTSFLKTHDFGNVSCNGLVVTDNNEAIIFDTPTQDKSAAELINWIEEKRNCKINAIIPTHFHDDCLGGLQAFHKHNIASYAYFKTVTLAKENHYVIPKYSFKDALTLKVGTEIIEAKFFGEGHTKDNIVGYFPSEKILFGGCLIKELDATKGYLGDANVADWSHTVEKIKNDYSAAKIVVPGHGIYGNQNLLDYTIQLFKQ